MEVKAGCHTSFWHDCWLTECPLEVSFYKLYQIASDPNLTVAEAARDRAWFITFRRQFNQEPRDMWLSLLELLNDVQLVEGVDSASWALEKSGKYTVKSLKVQFP